jgi:MYXO-CTERM domain-containing protein
MTCAGSASTDPTMPAPPPDCTTTPTTTVSQCQPPYYNLGFRSAQAGSADLGTTKTGTAGTTGTPETGGTTSPPGVGGSTSGNTGDPSGSGTSANHAAAGTDSQDSGGCQVAFGHGSSSGTALLGLLGFLGLSRRRRSRAA